MELLDGIFGMNLNKSALINKNASHEQYNALTHTIFFMSCNWPFVVLRQYIYVFN